MYFPPLNPDSFNLSLDQKFELEKLKVLVKSSHVDDIEKLVVHLFTQNCIHRNLVKDMVRGS